MYVAYTQKHNNAFVTVRRLKTEIITIEITLEKAIREQTKEQSVQDVQIVYNTKSDLYKVLNMP